MKVETSKAIRWRQIVGMVKFGCGTDVGRSL